MERILCSHCLSKDLNISDLSKSEAIELFDEGYDYLYNSLDIIKTFLDKIDLSDKKIITFCTSGGSPLEPAVEDLKKTYPNANIS